MTGQALFSPETACWICGSPALAGVGQLVFELSEYRRQDAELAAYTGAGLALNRCRDCGFAQPAALPTLPRYFDRMYDQRWADDWIRAEFESPVKDAIFGGILQGLHARLAPGRRRLLDVGAHAGRFVARAREQGWQAEGLELNPRTAAFAAEQTGGRVRQLNLNDIDPGIEVFDALTITDVLEHIPHPLTALRTAFALLAPGGCIAVKVPNGPAQLFKETWRGRLVRGYRPTVADNLVHVSHFSPRALELALRTAGFVNVHVEPGAPELPPGDGLRPALARSVRRALFAVARAVPGGVRTPLALNLQAYGTRA